LAPFCFKMTLSPPEMGSAPLPFLPQSLRGTFLGLFPRPAVLRTPTRPSPPYSARPCRFFSLRGLSFERTFFLPPPGKRLGIYRPSYPGLPIRVAHPSNPPPHPHIPRHKLPLSFGKMDSGGHFPPLSFLVDPQRRRGGGALTTSWSSPFTLPLSSVFSTNPPPPLPPPSFFFCSFSWFLFFFDLLASSRRVLARALYCYH